MVANAVVLGLAHRGGRPHGLDCVAHLLHLLGQGLCRVFQLLDVLVGRVALVSRGLELTGLGQVWVRLVRKALAKSALRLHILLLLERLHRVLVHRRRG